MQKGMSALPPKADMCGANSNVRFVPIADMQAAGTFSDECRSARQDNPDLGELTRLCIDLDEPACCFTMMSWLIERPRPVPSPVGLVVKNGLNIFSFTSGVIPVPLSRILISTRSPRFLVEAVRVGS